MIEARQFAAKHADWLEKQLRKQATRAGAPSWLLGTEILFRGQLVKLEAGPAGAIRLSDQVVRVAGIEDNLRPPVERYLHQIAAKELTNRVLELARLHEFTVRKITVRNQKSRWGSCSPRGTISLNWRLIQAPEFVRDYIILHELAHLKEMNHSRRFWREVARLCPDFSLAENWIKLHTQLLL
jgi:predicted metal-dependent hydrolase